MRIDLSDPQWFRLIWVCRQIRLSWEVSFLSTNDANSTFLALFSALGLRARIKKMQKYTINDMEFAKKKKKKKMQFKFPNATHIPVLKLMFFHLLFCKLHIHNERGWIVDALVPLWSSARSPKPIKGMCCMKFYCKFVVYSSQSCIFSYLVQCPHTSLVICFQIWSSCLLYKIMYIRKCVCALETPKQLWFII